MKWAVVPIEAKSLTLVLRHTVLKGPHSDCPLWILLTGNKYLLPHLIQISNLAFSYVDLPDLIHGRYGHCLAYLPLARGGGHLYAIGGLTGSPEEYSRSTECLTYDSDEGPSQYASWKELCPLNVARAFFGAVVHRCGIFIAGGIGANGNPLSTVEVFQRGNVNGRGQWSLLISRMNKAMPITGLALGREGILSFGEFNV